MLLRMYLKWSERKGFTRELIDYQPGDEAGIKSATVLFLGEAAFGLLSAEAGVHRLVRISPFDQAARRHTSFASVFVWPELPEDVDIEIDDKDLRVDTYRSSGAGGQHVNVTDSAVRITHLPTGIVVSCQNERSQHKNRASAMKVLKARLYDLKMKEQQAKLDQIGGEKRDIAFGSQIRSYVLQPYQMVKDHRTKLQVGDPSRVLDGDLDPFIKTYLMKKASGTLDAAAAPTRTSAPSRASTPAAHRLTSKPAGVYSAVTTPRAVARTLDSAREPDCRADASQRRRRVERGRRGKEVSCSLGCETSGRSGSATKAVCRCCGWTACC